MYESIWLPVEERKSLLKLRKSTGDRTEPRGTLLLIGKDREVDSSTITEIDQPEEATYKKIVREKIQKRGVWRSDPDATTYRKLSIYQGLIHGIPQIL